MPEARIRYVEGLQFIGEASSGHAIVLDAHEEIGGRDTGLRPAELLLIALGSCFSMGAVWILKKKQLDVKGFEVRLKGLKEEDWPKRMTDIEIEITVDGDNITEEAFKKSFELSMEKYCTVKATLQTPVNIRYSYKIIGDRGEAKSLVDDPEKRPSRITALFAKLLKRQQVKPKERV